MGIPGFCCATTIHNMIKIKKPDGMELPEEYNEGESMTALAEIKVTGDVIELISLENSEVTDVIEEEPEEEEVDEKPYPKGPPPEKEKVGPGGIPAGISNFVQGQLAQRRPQTGGLV